MILMSEKIDKLFEAMRGAKREFKSFDLNGFNPHFKSRYAELAAMTGFSFLEGASHAEEMVAAALEAGRVLMLDRPAVLDRARDWDIGILGFT